MIDLDRLIEEYALVPECQLLDVEVLYRFRYWVLQREDVEGLLPAARIPDGSIEIPTPGLTADLDEYLEQEEF